MTDDETLEWLDYHVDTFAIRDKLFEQPQATRDAWCRVVKPLDLAKAKAATDKMFAEPDLKPYKWQDHPGKIRQIAYGISNRDRPGTELPHMIDGQPVYNCLLCEDRGNLFVWAPVAVQAMRRGTFDVKTDRTCGVACRCKAGDKYAAAKWGRYDESRHVPCMDASDEKNIEALRARYGQQQKQQEIPF